MSKSTTGVRISGGVLSETILLLWGLLGLGRWDLPNLWIRIHHTSRWGVWVIVLPWRRWLRHHDCWLGRRVWRGYRTARIRSETCRSKVWVLKCLACCQTLCGVELKKALE